MLLNGLFAVGPSGGKGEGNKLSQSCKYLLRVRKVYLALLLLHSMLEGGGSLRDIYPV